MQTAILFLNQPTKLIENAYRIREQNAKSANALSGEMLNNSLPFNGLAWILRLAKSDNK